MAKTQNGWNVVASSSLNRKPFPGTKAVPAPGVKTGDVATVLHYVGTQFDKRVQKLVSGWCWGWAPATPIPGSNILSNHGSGTAIDLNAPNFPWKLRRMTAAQKKACRAIAKECSPVVAWGGDWSTPDEMHFEINGTAAQVKAVADRLKGNGATAQGGKVMDAEDVKAGYKLGPLGRTADAAGIKHYVGKKVSFMLADHYGSDEAKKKRAAEAALKKEAAKVPKLEQKVKDLTTALLEAPTEDDLVAAEKKAQQAKDELEALKEQVSGDVETVEKLKQIEAEQAESKKLVDRALAALGELLRRAFKALKKE